MQQERGPRKNKGRRRLRGLTGGSTAGRSESTAVDSTGATPREDGERRLSADGQGITASVVSDRPCDFDVQRLTSTSDAGGCSVVVSADEIQQSPRLSAFSKVSPTRDKPAIVRSDLSNKTEGKLSKLFWHALDSDVSTKYRIRCSSLKSGRINRFGFRVRI